MLGTGNKILKENPPPAPGDPSTSLNVLDLGTFATNSAKSTDDVELAAVDYAKQERQRNVDTTEVLLVAEGLVVPSIQDWLLNARCSEFPKSSELQPYPYHNVAGYSWSSWSIEEVEQRHAMDACRFPRQVHGSERQLPEASRYIAVFYNIFGGLDTRRASVLYIACPQSQESLIVRDRMAAFITKCSCSITWHTVP